MGCNCFDSLTFLEISESIITDYHLYYNITLAMKIKLEIEQGLNLIQKEEKKDAQRDNKQNKMPYEIILKDYLDEKIDGTELFDNKWYNNFEKGIIIYSKRSILAMINKAFDDKNNEFKEFYNQPPLKVSAKESGSFISGEYTVIKSIYKVNKNTYPPNTSAKMIAKYITYVKERTRWDSQLKLYEVIEGNEEGKEVKCLVHNWMKSPMFLVSERDSIEKRYEFYHEGKIYIFESSVNDDYYPLDEDVIRITNFIFIQVIYEENDNIIIEGLTQVNPKVNLPQAVLIATIPNKLLDYLNGLEKGINKDFEEGKLVFEDNNGNIL
jgi:hypothetical protein